MKNLILKKSYKIFYWKCLDNLDFSKVYFNYYDKADKIYLPSWKVVNICFICVVYVGFFGI